MSHNQPHTEEAKRKIGNAFRGKPGRVWSDEAKVRALSWTLLEEKARWFSTRWGKVGKLYKAVIPKKAVYAYFAPRGEEEVVVNSRMLKDIVKI